METSTVALGTGSLTASGVAIGTEPLPYELHYELETEDGFATRLLTVESRGQGWHRRVALRHDGRGGWAVEDEASGDSGLPAPGGDPASVAGALDCDLGGSPLTNSLPVLRHRLIDGGEDVDLDTAWVSVPALEVRRSEQRYRFVESRLDGTVIRFELRDGTFAADLELDADGFVHRYPGLAELLS